MVRAMSPQPVVKLSMMPSMSVPLELATEAALADEDAPRG